MTIGVFARRTGLSVSALRFYADRELLVPAEVDRASGYYRRYTEAQVGDGVLIRNLRRLEMPLAEIALALRCPEPERRQLVERHLRRLEQVVAWAHTLAQTMGFTMTPREAAMSATLHALDLGRALDQVLPAAGTDPELPHLIGLLIEAKAGSVRLVATDRYRLAVRDLVPTSLDSEFSAVVPAATLSPWRGALAGPGEVVLTVDDRHLRVVGGDVDLTALLLPATFPDYERFLVPAEDVTRVQVDREGLLAALASFGGDRTIVLTPSAGSLRIGDDEQSARIGATCKGVEQQVAVNARFATDAVGHAVGAEIVIDIDDPLSPVLFRSADDGTFTTRVMPVKLDQPGRPHGRSDR